MNWGQAFQWTLALFTIAATIYATRVNKRGKIAEVAQSAAAAMLASEQADRKQRFEELKTSLDAARLDLIYYQQQLILARTDAQTAESEKDRLQTEWIERHRKMLVRCQALTTQIEKVLNGVVEIPKMQRVQMEAVIEEVAEHLQNDHQHFES